MTATTSYNLPSKTQPLPLNSLCRCWNLQPIRSALASMASKRSASAGQSRGPTFPIVVGVTLARTPEARKNFAMPSVVLQRARRCICRVRLPLKLDIRLFINQVIRQ